MKIDFFLIFCMPLFMHCSEGDKKFFMKTIFEIRKNFLFTDQSY
jgi:hypothetical protein